MNDNTMNNMLSEDDREYIQKFGDLAFENTNYELECLINYPKPNRTNFAKVLELCRKKTCVSTWKCIKEKSVTLDIAIVGTRYRITIFGSHYVNKYVKTNTLDGLPRGSWCVIKKNFVILDDDDDFYKRVGCNLIPKDNNDNRAERELENIGCKLNLKSEEPIDPNSPDFTVHLNNWDNIKKTFRLKKRYSFLVANKYSVDLTAVRTTSIKAKTVREANTLNGREFYEIEVEYLPDVEGDITSNESIRNKFDIESWTLLMNDILCEYLDSWHVYPIDVLCSAEDEYYNTLAGMEKSDIKNLSVYNLNPQVVTLTMSRLRNLEKETKDYFVCPKSDGLRMNGYISSNGELYLFGSKSSLWHPTGCRFDERHHGTIFDGELCRQMVENKNIAHYLVFDCYWEDGTEIREKKFTERKATAISIIEDGFEINESLIGVEFNIEFKKFISCADNLFGACRQCFEDIDKGIYENDGLIFTPNDKVGGSGLYNSNDTKFVKSGVTFDKMLKWKDSHYNSIDFKVKFTRETEAPRILGNDYVLTKLKRCELYSLYTSEPQPFTYNDYQKFSAMSEDDKLKAIAENSEYYGKNGKLKEFIPHSPVDTEAKVALIPIVDGRVRCKSGTTWTGSAISDGDIVEMIYDVNETPQNRWIPIRVRTDKSKPNAFNVAIDIWRSFYVPVSLEIMKGTDPVPSNAEEQDVYYNVDAKKNKIRGNLRNFHTNCCKDRIFASTIGNTDGKRLLDLGSGKAGDLSRYIAYGVNEVVGVDNSVDNLHNSHDGAYRRLFNWFKDQNKDKHKKMHKNRDGSEKLPDKVLFLAADVGKPLKDASSYHGEYKEIYKTSNYFTEEHYFDAATVFFALHYFFKNTTTMRTFLKNVSDNVKIGGYFGGCCYDGQIIFDELKKNNGMVSFSDSDGTELLRIIQNYKSTDFPSSVESLGNEIRVLVQSIGAEHNEYLVNFDLLKKELYALGFVEVEEHCQNFKVYYETQAKNNIHMTEEEKRVSFLNRAFVFKRIEYKSILDVKRADILPKD